MTRLLLVEDDADIVKNLTLLLQQDGFEVTTASGQAAALQAQVALTERTSARTDFELVATDSGAAV